MGKVRDLIIEFEESLQIYEELFIKLDETEPFVELRFDIGLNTNGVLRYFDIIRYITDYLDAYAYKEERLKDDGNPYICLVIFGRRTRAELCINFLRNAVKAVEEDARIEHQYKKENITHIRTRLAGKILYSILKVRSHKPRLPYKAYNHKLYLRDVRYAADQMGVSKGKQRLKAGYGRR